MRVLVWSLATQVVDGCSIAVSLYLTEEQAYEALVGVIEEAWQEEGEPPNPVYAELRARLAREGATPATIAALDEQLETGDILASVDGHHLDV